MESALVHDTHQLGEAIAVSHKKRRPRFRGRFIKNSRQPLLFLLQQVNPDLAFCEKKEREIRPFEHQDHHANQNSFF